MKRRSDIYIRGMVSDNKVTKFKLRKYVIDVRHLTMIDGLLIMNINIYIHINKPSIIRLKHVIGMLVWEATQYNGQTLEVEPLTTVYTSLEGKPSISLQEGNHHQICLYNAVTNCRRGNRTLQRRHTSWTTIHQLQGWYITTETLVVGV